MVSEKKKKAKGSQQFLDDGELEIEERGPTRETGSGEVRAAELSSRPIGSQSFTVESGLEVLQSESVLEDIGIAEEKKNSREVSWRDRGTSSDARLLPSATSRPSSSFSDMGR